MVSLLLAFDLDGTLIPEGGLMVPQSTRRALARLNALGVKIAIITGRDVPPDDVLDAAQPTAVAHQQRRAHSAERRVAPRGSLR